jgi:NitT/TauT family transport system substrate-binding protein
MSKRLLSLLAILLAFTMVAAACGDDDDTGSDDDTTTGDDTDADDDTPPADDDDDDDMDDDDMDAISAERCAANTDAGTVTFVTGFDFAAAAGIIDIIVADAEGYFEELCIDVDIQPGFAPSNGALVIEGQAQFGMAGSFAELVANNEAGEGDLVAVLHWGRTAIEAIVLPEGSEITDFAGLCGTTVGIKGDLPYSLQAAVALSGIERSCFDEILLDGFDPVAHLDLGVDALPVYKSNEPNTLDSQGVVYTTLDPLDFDVPSSFGVSFTTQSFIDENPDLTEDIVRALVKGQATASADPEGAVASAFELIDAAGNDLFLAQETELFRWGVESGLITSLAPAGVGIGIPDTDLLGAEVDAMVDAGVFDEAPDWASMVDASIAAGVYDGDTLLWPTS